MLNAALSTLAFLSLASALLVPLGAPVGRPLHACVGTPVPVSMLAAGPSAGAAAGPSQLEPPPRALVSMQAAAGTSRGQLLEPLPTPKELYDAVSTQTGLAVVLFSSRQCALCRALLPRVRRMAATLPDVRFFAIDHSAATDEAFKYHEVTQVPSFILFDGAGNVVDSMSGLTPSDWGAFKQLVEQHADGCRNGWGM